MSMEEDEPTGTIRLRSKDEKTFDLPEKAANLSELVQDSPREEDSDVTQIDIARVNSECLGKVVEFMNHDAEEKMKDIPTPLGGSSFNEVSGNRIGRAIPHPCMLLLTMVLVSLGC